MAHDLSRRHIEWVAKAVRGSVGGLFTVNKEYGNAAKMESRRKSSVLDGAGPRQL